MKKNIIIAVMVGACLVSESSAMAQEMLKLKAKDNQEFELEKDHALLSETINDAYEDLADQEGKLKEAIPLGNVTQGEIADLLSGQNYEYILRIYRAYNEGKNADPEAIRNLSAEERKRIGEARALDPVIFSTNSLKEAWDYLQAAHYLKIYELIEKYARIVAIMLCSDASLRLLQANNQEHVKMVREINKNRTFADFILHYIPEIWVQELTMVGLEGFTSASFSPDGNKIVTASQDRTAKIWNAQTGRRERTFEGHTDSVRSASFSPSPDGSKVVTASDDGTAKIWNVRTGECERTIAAGLAVISASFSPDGSKIVTAADETAKIWNASTGALELTLTGHTNYVNTASFSPDGSKIVTASYDKTAKIWNAQTGVVELTLAGHTDYVLSASFSPNGKKIVTGSKDASAKIWNAQTGVLEHTLSDHTKEVVSARFSPDDNKIVTGSKDASAKIWNVQTGGLEDTLTGHTDYVNSASFSSNGKKIVTASKDQRVTIWASLPARTMEQALFLQYLQFVKNQGGRPGWASGWGGAMMDTFERDEKMRIKECFPN